MAKKKGDPLDGKDVIKGKEAKANIIKGKDAKGKEAKGKDAKGKDAKGKDANQSDNSVQKTVNKDEEVQIDLRTLLNSIGNDAPQTQKDMIIGYKNYLNSIDWKCGLKKGEVTKYRQVWSGVCDSITNIPLISDVLRLNISISEKSEFIHKLIVLYGISFDSFEFIQVKKILAFQYNKYKTMQLTESQLTEFSRLEENITDIAMLESSTSLKYTILESKMSNKNKAYVYSRYQQLVGEDNGKLKNWIQHALGVPTEVVSLGTQLDTVSARDSFLVNIKNILDAELYGMNTVKEQLLFFINNRISKGNTRANALALEGLPGIGKTCIIQALSKALNVPMACIPIGGAKDASVLNGHGYTYEGSMPGSIVQALQELKCLNGIIFIDEIDKIPQTDKGNEISKALLHIIDPSQNFAYHDKYLTNQFDIDLSKIWFIYTLNDRNNIEQTLRDRIPIIHIDGYAGKEKFDIVKSYLIPNALGNVNVSTDAVQFNDAAINHIIKLVRVSGIEITDSHGRSGVRQVKYLIEYIVMKINILVSLWDPNNEYQPSLKLSFSIPGFKLPLLVTPDVIDKLSIQGLEANNQHLSMYL